MIKIESVQKLPAKMEESILFVSWKHKDNEGESCKTVVSNRMAVWNETFDIYATVQSTAKGGYIPRRLTLTLKEV